jgi:hypothetical protein
MHYISSIDGDEYSQFLRLLYTISPDSCSHSSLHGVSNRSHTGLSILTPHAQKEEVNLGRES